jgi:hypothetical protein
MNSITIIGISFIILYSLTKILSFYGVGEEQYGIYVLFYILIVVTSLILPKDYPKV